jgi:outer membrane protein assembly factor BamD (BamD/ComL family)
MLAVAKASPRDEAACRNAQSAFAIFLRNYPDSAQADEARKHLDRLTERLAKMYYERAAFYDTTLRKPRAALVAYSDFVRNFPASKMAPAVRRRMEALQRLVENDDE